MAKTYKNAKDALAAAGRADPKATKHVFVLMDESGSMSGLEESVTTGCNEFIHAFKDDADARIWLAWFDQSPGEARTRFKIKGEAAASVAQLKPSDYVPRGMTPLNDAIADAVAALDSAIDEGDVVFLAVITDGMENASEHSDSSIKQLLEQREQDGWGVVLIGANQDTAATAASRGMVKPGQAFDFDATELKVTATMRSASKIAKLRLEHGAGRSGKDRYDRAVAEEHARRGGRLDEDE